MKTAWKRRAWLIFKWLLALAILLAIGRQFYGDLARLDLHQLELRPGWLILSAVLYLLGLSLSAWYWYHLLHAFDQRPRLFATVRGYFLGHLGKYVPGKAWALLLRADCVAGPEVRFGVAIISSFYEVLTTMAAGALVAAAVFTVDPRHVPGLDWHPLWTGLILLALCGVPLLPGVFNFVVARMARRFEKIESYALPRLRLTTLVAGLAATSAGWALLGLAVWALLQAVLPEPPALGLETWARCTGSIGLAYVAGFLAVFLPGGIGVREYLLRYLLAFAGPEALIVVAVLLLRVVWTAAEVLLAGVLVGARGRQGDKETRRQGDQPDKETRRQGDKETSTLSKDCHPTSPSGLHFVSLSPCLLVSLSG
jgi:uncharacterized membrane protein YbhN (UPF0104 family)